MTNFTRIVGTLAVMTLIVLTALSGVACINKGKLGLRLSGPGVSIDMGKGWEPVYPEKIQFSTQESYEANVFDACALVMKPGTSKVQIAYIMTTKEKAAPQDLLREVEFFGIAPLVLKGDLSSEIVVFGIAQPGVERMGEFHVVVDQTVKAIELSASDPLNGYMYFEYPLPPAGSAPEGCYVLTFVNGAVGSSDRGYLCSIFLKFASP